LPISYVVKRLVRSWQLYVALFLGVVLASTFFAGVNVGADTAAKQALDQALENVPVDFYINGWQMLSSQDATTMLQRASALDEVTDAEVISRVSGNVQLPNEPYPQTFRLVGITSTSRVYQGWTEQPSSIPENQTYVLANSGSAKSLKQGDIIQVNMSMSMPVYGPGVPEQQTTTYLVNLTIAGFAKLDQTATALIQGSYYTYNFGVIYAGPGSPVIYPSPGYAEDLLIVDWNQTMARFVDVFHETGNWYFENDILVYIDRNKVISIWDIPGSLNRLEILRRKIENQIMIGGIGLFVQSGLQSVLAYSQMTVTAMRVVFVAVSLPVFFVAWYMGSTVSDVSFNLRRREIGLLLTKGFSRSQLFRMFLFEALLIGIVGGIVGILLSLGLTPVFVRAAGGEFVAAPTIGIDTMIMTTVFSIAIVILAVFNPARRASNLTTVDALREYTLVEDVKPYRKRLPWIAFALGTYKLIILALGINLINEVGRLAMYGGNFLLVILVGVWALFDVFILTYIGPVLFFWGFTKIFVRGSLKFQELTARVAKFLGDLGALATRNVQRNPARAASTAFLIALIIGYGIQITGTLASDQDYNTRLIYASVGADVRVDLPPPANVSATMDLVKTLHENVTSIASTTTEYSFYGTSSFGGLQLLAINTTDWRNTAYYEDGWFTGNDITKALEQLASNNRTIILDRDVAERNELHIGDTLRGVSFEGGRFGGPVGGQDLTIVGFFGVKRPDSSIFGQTSVYTSRSYVSDELFYDVSSLVANASSTRILIKLTSGADGIAAADQIKELVGTLVQGRPTVYSVSEQIQQLQASLSYTGTLNVQRLGVAFAILAASVGTALVSLVSLRERQREASMMAVRGLSFKQLTIMLLTENLAVVTFAVLLGTLAGLILVYGNVASSSSTIASLVSKRLVFPVDSLLTIFAYVGLVFASTIIPVILMSRKYISRLERVVRQV